MSLPTLGRILSRKLVRLHNTLYTQTARTVLSDAYACNDAWKQRLETPVLQKIDVGQLAMKLQDRMDREAFSSAVDMDVLANKLEFIDILQLDFALNLFKRFRGSRETVCAFESMSHAVARTLLSLGEHKKLMDVIQDKVGYGVFLDNYMANILMDHYIKSTSYAEAAKIAYDLMYQEDFGQPLTQVLAWYACHLHYSNLPATEPEAEATPPADEEDEWVRVNFIRHPWYDGHWDISKDRQLLGKTLYVLSNGSSGTLETNYKLLGLALWEKWDQVLDGLATYLQTDELLLIKQTMIDLKNLLEGQEVKETPEAKEPGEMTMEDVDPYITSDQKEAYSQQLQELEQKLESANKISTDIVLEDELTKLLNTTIAEHQESEIEQQKSLLEKWNQERDAQIQQQILDAQQAQKKADILERLQDIQAKEERLSYFEERQRIGLSRAQAPKERSLDEAKEEELFVAAPAERGKSKS